MVALIVLCHDVDNFLCCWRLLFLTECPPIGKIAAHSAYDVLSWYKYLIHTLHANYRYLTNAGVK